MKYEMVFGDDGLFFDAQKDCEMVGNGHHKVENGKLMVWNFSEKYWAESHTNTITISAMRRIIAEPKRWTLEDKRAGRMPEVGSRVDFCHKLNTNWRTGEIKYIDNQVVVIKADDIDRPFVYEFDRVEFKPVETPEEKAQREEDEFVNNVSKEASRRMTETDLGFYTDGIRAAYRKLKITEVE